MSRRRTHPAEIPLVIDDFWPDFCLPLAQFIEEKDRTWTEVSAWGRGRKINGFFLRNALAWLEHNGLVHTYLPEGTKFSVQGKWIWTVTDEEKMKWFAAPRWNLKTILPRFHKFAEAVSDPKLIEEGYVVAMPTGLSCPWCDSVMRHEEEHLHGEMVATCEKNKEHKVVWLSWGG